MADYGDIVTRLAVDSDILRIYPNALVQIFESGTSNLVWEGTADANGNWDVPTLVTGKYDIKVDGQIRRTIHHIKADHTHIPPESWMCFKGGAITSDQDESNAVMIYGCEGWGTITKVVVLVQEVDASGDMYVHILKGASGGGAILTVASNSVWNHRVNPGSAVNRYMHEDDNPGIDVGAGETVTIGIDFVATAVKGLTVLMVFEPSS